MVSSWWLLVSFLAGGYAGFLLLAMLAVSRGTDDDTHSLIARGRGSPQPEVEEGSLTHGQV
jgi:hypothetical protein